MGTDEKHPDYETLGHADAQALRSLFRIMLTTLAVLLTLLRYIAECEENGER
jgi:hypothetical protein